MMSAFLAPFPCATRRVTTRRFQALQATSIIKFRAVLAPKTERETIFALEMKMKAISTKVAKVTARMTAQLSRPIERPRSVRYRSWLWQNNTIRTVCSRRKPAYNSRGNPDASLGHTDHNPPEVKREANRAENASIPFAQISITSTSTYPKCTQLRIRGDGLFSLRAEGFPGTCRNHFAESGALSVSGIISGALSTPAVAKSSPLAGIRCELFIDILDHLDVILEPSGSRARDMRRLNPQSNVRCIASAFGSAASGLSIPERLFLTACHPVRASQRRAHLRHGSLHNVL